LARLQAEIGLASLLRHAPELRLAAPPDSIVWHESAWGRRPARLPLRFVPIQKTTLAKFSSR
jgi:cytochrome P450